MSIEIDGIARSQPTPIQPLAAPDAYSTDSCGCIFSRPAGTSIGYDSRASPWLSAVGAAIWFTPADGSPASMPLIFVGSKETCSGPSGAFTVALTMSVKWSVLETISCCSVSIATRTRGRQQVPCSSKKKVRTSCGVSPAAVSFASSYGRLIVMSCSNSNGVGVNR